MSHQQGDADEDIEIVDSGHQTSTRRTEEGIEEFWAVVQNSRSESVTVELQLHNEEDVLATHRETQTVAKGETERYRFVVSIPPDFDQYVFAIVDRDDT